MKVFKDRGGMEKSMEKFFHDLNTFFLCPCFQNTIMVTSNSLQNEDTARGMEIMTPYTLHIQKKVTWVKARFERWGYLCKTQDYFIIHQWISLKLLVVVSNIPMHYHANFHSNSLRFGVVIGYRPPLMLPGSGGTKLVPGKNGY